MWHIWGILFISSLALALTTQLQQTNGESRSVRQSAPHASSETGSLFPAANDRLHAPEPATADIDDLLLVDKPGKTRKTYINLEQYMRNLTRIVGSKAIFYCDILGQPIPEFHWYRNGQKLNSNTNRIRIETGLWGSSLRVEQIKKSDEGTYMCVASNPSGKVNITAYLWVTEKVKPSKGTNTETMEEALLPSAPETDGFCQEFHSNVCGKYLMGHRVYVTREYQQALIEAEISKFLKVAALQPLHRIREDCLRNLMEVTCYYNFPVCVPVLDNSANKDGPADQLAGSKIPTTYKPLALCRQDCYSTMQHECAPTYNYLERKLLHEVPSMIMDCDRLPVYNPNHPNTCRSPGQPIPEAIEVTIPTPVRHHTAERPIHPQQETDVRDETLRAKQKLTLTLKPTSTGPDLVPLFISVGVMFLVGFALLAFCFLCRKNWDPSIRLQTDSSGLFGRSRHSSGFGRLNGGPCGHGVNGNPIRGQGVGAPKDFSGKRSKVSGMGAHLKCSKKAPLLTCPDDTYTVAYSPRNNTLVTQSDSNNNLASTCAAVSNAQNSLSSAPNSQLALTSDQTNVPHHGSLVFPQQTHMQNGSVPTYHQYQAPNFAAPPPLPPPNSPAPPPPDARTMNVTTTNIMVPSSGFFFPTPASLAMDSSQGGVSHVPIFNHTSGDQLLALTPNNTGSYETNGNAESPTAYTTLRDSNSNGFQCNQLLGSPTIRNRHGTQAEKPAEADENFRGPIEIPISHLRHSE